MNIRYSISADALRSSLVPAAVSAVQCRLGLPRRRRLLLCDIDPTALEATVDRIAALGRRAVPVVCDVSDPEQIRAMYRTLDAEYGKIDILAT